MARSASGICFVCELLFHPHRHLILPTLSFVDGKVRGGNTAVSSEIDVELVGDSAASLPAFGGESSVNDSVPNSDRTGGRMARFISRIQRSFTPSVLATFLFPHKFF